MINSSETVEPLIIKQGINASETIEPLMVNRGINTSETIPPYGETKHVDSIILGAGESISDSYIINSMLAKQGKQADVYLAKNGVKIMLLSIITEVGNLQVKLKIFYRMLDILILRMCLKMGFMVNVIMKYMNIIQTAHWKRPGLFQLIIFKM